MTNVPAGAATSRDLFKEALARVLIHEGGKVDHPKDPGGRTNKGITQRVYNGWRTKSFLPIRDVYLISDMEVEAIYRFQYWEPIKGDQLPPGVGYVVFDGAVNSGPRQSSKWLQRAIGAAAGTVDGIIGSVTLSAAQQDHDHDALIARISARRMAFLKALKTWPTFSKGWSRRVAHVEATGQAWAMGSVGPEVVYIPGAERKAPVEDGRSAPPKAPGDIGVGVGGAGSGGALSLDQVLNTAKDQLEPYAAFGWVKSILVTIIIIGVVVAGASFAYRWWAARKAAELTDALDLEAAP
jgi:lysozyme family protein